MKLRHPSLIRLLGLLGAWLFRWWIGTVGIRVRIEDGSLHPADPRKQRYIYAFWHEGLLVPASYSFPVHVLISKHADGELIAQMCRHLRIGVVRGSTTDGGRDALSELLRKSRKTHLGITPDGPHGPRRCLQMGLIALASLSGLPIVPLGVGYSWAIRTRSWDRFAIPIPWSSAVYLVAPAIHVPSRLKRAEFEAYRQLVEAEMRRVTEKAERLAARTADSGKRSGVAPPAGSERPAA